jgi:hypothetical protein
MSVSSTCLLTLGTCIALPPSHPKPNCHGPLGPTIAGPWVFGHNHRKQSETPMVGSITMGPWAHPLHLSRSIHSGPIMVWAFGANHCGPSSPQAQNRSLQACLRKPFILSVSPQAPCFPRVPQEDGKSKITALTGFVRNSSDRSIMSQVQWGEFGVFPLRSENTLAEWSSTAFLCLMPVHKQGISPVNYAVFSYMKCDYEHSFFSSNRVEPSPLPTWPWPARW